MKSFRLLAMLLLAGLSFQSSARAALTLPAIFGDNMILQQQLAVPVWGWAAPQANVTVKFAGQIKTARADANGLWRVTLGKLKASFSPQSLVIAADDTKTFTNILVGEVWLASGQSNMEKPVGNQPGQKPTWNAEQELAAADYPNLRLFKVEKMLSASPRTQLEKFYGWQACNSNALEAVKFSAAAYFFGRELHTNLNVPVGLIESSWGGTRIEPWTPPAGFAAVPSLAHIKLPESGTNKLSNTAPTVLYNAMIAPLAGFAMKGAIWYQGESNIGETNYDLKMAALIGGWRQVWNEGAFPFYFVQIAPFKYFGGKTPRVKTPFGLPEFWTLQSQAARHIPNTGMVVTTDLVDDLNDIHPRNKKEVGHRLALLARDKTYGQKVVSSGPVFKSMKISGNRAVLTFDHTAGALGSMDAQPLTWFTIAGADGKFVSAEAKVAGDTVQVSAVGVDKPVVVRFAWDELAQPDFINAAGLPAEPFSAWAGR